VSGYIFGSATRGLRGYLSICPSRKMIQFISSKDQNILHCETKKNCALLVLAATYQTALNFGNFWYRDTAVNLQRNCPPFLMGVSTLPCEI